MSQFITTPLGLIEDLQTWLTGSSASAKRHVTMYATSLLLADATQFGPGASGLAQYYIGDTDQLAFDGLLFPDVSSYRSSGPADSPFQLVGMTTASLFVLQGNVMFKLGAATPAPLSLDPGLFTWADLSGVERGTGRILVGFSKWEQKVPH